MAFLDAFFEYFSSAGIAWQWVLKNNPNISFTDISFAEFFAVSRHNAHVTSFKTA